MLQKIYISDKCCSFELSIRQIILKTRKFCSAVFNVVIIIIIIIIKNVFWAANQHIRMISEGSCDTEDWSNDAENTALITEINYILTDIHIENSYFKQ